MTWPKYQKHIVQCPSRMKIYSHADTAIIQPDSGQKAFFAARMERDKARHKICLTLQRERDICLATVRAGIWLDLNVTGRA